MPVVACGQCRARYRVPDAAVGKKIRCPKCQAIIEVKATVPEAIANLSLPSAVAQSAPPAPAGRVGVAPSSGPVEPAPTPSRASGEPSRPASSVSNPLPTVSSEAASVAQSQPLAPTPPPPTSVSAPLPDRGPTRICFSSGKLKGQERILTGELVFGCDPACHVIIPDGSERQAVIKRMATGWWFRDLGGKGAVPIIINDVRLVEKVLNDQDRIRIGPMCFVFNRGVDLPAEPPREPSPQSSPKGADIRSSPVESRACPSGGEKNTVAPGEARGPTVLEQLGLPEGADPSLAARVTEILTESANPEAALDIFVSVTLSSIPQAERLVLAAVDPKTGDIDPKPIRGRSSIGESIGEIPALSVFRKVLETGQPYISGAAVHKGVFDLLAESAAGSQSVLCVPLKHGKTLLGCLFLDNGSKANAFGPGDRSKAEELVRAFSVLLHEIRLQTRLRWYKQREEMFSKYVSVDLVERLESAGHAAQTRGELKKLTVLFTDIRGFTAMSEGMEPQKLIAMMNRYFEAMVDAINRYDGYVNKFIGDSIMAFWGAPEAKSIDSLQAVRAAILMQRHLHFLNQSRAKEGLAPIYMGVGIHTGNAVVGNVGSAERKEYSALGDTVNTASRIEALTKLELPIWEQHHRIFLSEAVYSEVKDQVKVEPLPPQTVKGKAQALNIFSVKGVLEAAMDEERKRSQVVPYSGAIKVRSMTSEMSLSGTTVGVSRIGLSAGLPQPLPMGLDVIVDLSTGRRGWLAEIPARVVEVSEVQSDSKGYLVELSFDTLPTSKLRQLEDFVQMVEQGSNVGN